MKTVFSGVAPSGTIHLGNYLGAIKNWVELQKTHQCIFCVVDLHAITIPQDPEKLRAKILEVAAIYLATGIDPEKSIVFIQSHNQDHTELAWILNTITKNSDLTRMTQFKDKTNVIDFITLSDDIEKRIKDDTKNAIRNIEKTSGLPDVSLLEMGARVAYSASSTTINYLKKFFLTPFNKASIGLFDYPVLMASDILLYGTDVVPVGEDQKQHVELARTLARRFNQQYGEIFKIPESVVQKQGARIMGLDDPTKKMSKSATSSANYIALTDSPDIIRDKIKKAMTDSGSEIKYDPKNKPAISNLLTIFSLVSNKNIQQIEKDYSEHTAYADFKNDLAEEIIKCFSPFQKKYNELMAEPEYLKEILETGAQKAKKISNKVLTKAKTQMGIL